MSMTLNIFFICCIAVVISWLATALVRRLALRWGVVDRPDSPRKIHTAEMPLLGGWALYFTTIIMMIALFYFRFIPDGKVSVSVLTAFAIAGFCLMLGGYIDDRSKAPWYITLAFPVLAALIMVVFGLTVSYITNPFGGLIYIQSWPVILTGTFVFLWLMAMMYTTKLLDGLDGLASSIGIVASFVIFIVSLFWDDRGSTTTYIAIIFMGALIGFLIWNWHPAKIFLGEAGSTYIGFTLGVLAILTGGKFATALLVMGIPMLDVLWVIVRRLTSRHQITLADTGHLHFRLLRSGLKQQQVVLVMSGLALLFGAVSFFSGSFGKIIALVVLVLAMLILGSYVLKKQRV